MFISILLSTYKLLHSISQVEFITSHHVLIMIIIVNAILPVIGSVMNETLVINEE